MNQFSSTRLALGTVALFAPVFSIFILAWIATFGPCHSWGGNISFQYDSAGRLISADYGTNHTASYAYDNSGNLLVASAPAPVIVVGPVVSGQLTLSWPAAPAGFTLQKSSSLDAGAIWTPVTGQIASGNFFVISVPLGATSTFYRLVK